MDIRCQFDFPHSRSSSKMVTLPRELPMITTASVLSSSTKNVSSFSNMVSLMMVTWPHWMGVLVLKVSTPEVVMKSILAADT